MKLLVSIGLAAFLTALSTAQAVKLSWASALTLPCSQVNQIYAIPGGGFLATGGDAFGDANVIGRISDNATVAYSVTEPSVQRFGTIKFLPDGNFYVAGSGGKTYIGKYNLSTGAKVGSFTDPNISLVGDTGPDLTSYFIQIAAGAWTAAPAGSPDTQQIQVTLTLLRVSDTLVTTSYPLPPLTLYGHNNTAYYQYQYDFPRILFYKNQVFAAIGGRYVNGNGGASAPFLAAWSLDANGVELWGKSSVLDTSSIAGTHNYFPLSLGFDLSGNLTAAYQQRDGSAGSAGPTVGVTLNGTTGAPMTFSGSTGLADHEYTTNGFYYREYTDLPRSLSQYQGESSYSWHNTPGASLMKRNGADTSTIWTNNAQAIGRLPFQIVDVLFDPTVSTAHFSIAALRDTDLSGVTTQITPSASVAMTAVAQQPDTGIMLVGGANFNDKPFFAELISQPVLNSYTYSVPKNHAYTSPNSIFFADRFTAGLSPQIGQYVKHGTLVLHTDGTFVYTPATGFTGTDFFIYRVQRPGLPTVSAEIGLSVS